MVEIVGTADTHIKMRVNVIDVNNCDVVIAGAVYEAFPWTMEFRHQMRRTEVQSRRRNHRRKQ